MIGEGGTGKGEGYCAISSYPSPFPVPPSPAVLRWQFWVDPAGRSGAENMALDQTLLDEVDRRGDVAYLRLYRWSPPCLSFGRNEPALSRYDRSEIDRLGLDVVRRPTGGRAVWHDDELTYAVVAPTGTFGCLRDSYHVIHQRLARALLTLGAEATLAPPGAHPGALSAGACFARPVGGEVLVRGRKVVGSAQVRQGDAFLQHGSILLGGSQGIVARVSRQNAPSPAATTLSQALGRPIEFGEVARAIADTWPEEGELATRELSAYPPIRASAFANSAWTWRR